MRFIALDFHKLLFAWQAGQETLPLERPAATFQFRTDLLEFYPCIKSNAVLKLVLGYPRLLTCRRNRLVSFLFVEVLVNDIRQMCPRLILSSHLPPTDQDMTEKLLEAVALATSAQPFVGPNQVALQEMLKQMTHGDQKAYNQGM